MTHARQRLSLLALGILAPVLALGAIALSDAPLAEAIGEEPYTVQGWNCDAPGEYVTYCDEDAGTCSTSVYVYCDGGFVSTTWSYPSESSDESPDSDGCDIGIADFNYCP